MKELIEDNLPWLLCMLAVGIIAFFLGLEQGTKEALDLIKETL